MKGCMGSGQGMAAFGPPGSPRPGKLPTFENDDTDSDNDARHSAVLDQDIR